MNNVTSLEVYRLHRIFPATPHSFEEPSHNRNGDCDDDDDARLNRLRAETRAKLDELGRLAGLDGAVAGVADPAPVA